MSYIINKKMNVIYEELWPLGVLLTQHV